MPTYQLQIKQIVDYPRCRIYRQFVRFPMEGRSIRISGGSGLFCGTFDCHAFKLDPFSGCCREGLLHRAHEQYLLRFGLAVLCGNKQVTTFELTLSPSVEN